MIGTDDGSEPAVPSTGNGATLVIVGGGGFRVPLVYRALAAGPFAGLVSDVVLLDALPARAHAMARVLAAMPGTAKPSLRVESRLEDALPGAHIVFAAVRSGGADGRVLDERVALAAGLLGQETVGAGGISYALRSIPDMMRVAEGMRALAPEAWLINFTNPAGMVTEAVSAVLGQRVIGICDSASGLVTRAARAAGLHLGASLEGVDYVGLNHLGWLRGLQEPGGGPDHLPALLSDPQRLGAFEEGRLFGPDLLRTLGALPNEYLFYYYFHREALRSIRTADRTRGEILRDQQGDLYPRLTAAADPLAVWEDARRERESGYLAEARAADEERDEADLAGGGYEQVALRVMRALLTGVRAELILNVRNGTTLPGLPEDAVVEVPAGVDQQGAVPLPARPLAEHQLGLMAAVKAVEQDTIRAAVHRDRDAALRAFAGHPLIDSFHAASAVLKGYEAVFPSLGSTWSR
ncbi:6-phospho-beta-glucosidase [Arthrobacter agilis]|uniref:family 4 glycosyl hydrolase n=1 Tax=Arthrobacter agilis TaxID=37921 RepID=UPI000B34D420|nr:6-phospho-beta-glucosidase [Arthrobacter agilis]OUM41505.1 6-phospho-beta-glucosidase [Arthrobacter agilis]PPB46166.1 6-phospho-beta-glucosidase [Arthrobacter agilis]TPV26918.1 6-phospho-beta-glucosidase [Arthrobacter agilis]VDR32955.1 Phospho-alpha-glucosidase pagL [Arthrobacter agilis]